MLMYCPSCGKFLEGKPDPTQLRWKLPNHKDPADGKRCVAANKNVRLEG